MTDLNALNSEWVDARKAAKILGVPGARNVHRLVRSGLIKTRDFPGVRAKFSRADVESLAAERGGSAKTSMTYLFDVHPEPGEDGGLISAVIQYKLARDERRTGGPTLWFGPTFEFLFHVGGLAIRHVNRALDRDADAFLKALDGPDLGDDGEWTEGAAARFWETLARLQAEGSTGPTATVDDDGAPSGSRTETASLGAVTLKYPKDNNSE